MADFKRQPLHCKNTSPLNELNRSTAECSQSFNSLSKSQAENVFREISIISSPTSVCMAQSGTGALESWSESSALLVVFCATAESLGPRSSLANCCAPPRALSAIKGKCANGVRQCGDTSLLLKAEANTDAISRTAAAVRPQQLEDGDGAMLGVDTSLKTGELQNSHRILLCCLSLYEAEQSSVCLMGQLKCVVQKEMRQTRWETLQGAAGKGLRSPTGANQSLHSHSTWGGCCIYQTSQNTAAYTHTHTYMHPLVERRVHSARARFHTHNTDKHRRGSPNWLGCIHKPVQSLSDFFTSQLCSAFFWKGRSASLHAR